MRKSQGQTAFWIQKHRFVVCPTERGYFVRVTDAEGDSFDLKNETYRTEADAFLAILLYVEDFNRTGAQ